MEPKEGTEKWEESFREDYSQIAVECGLGTLNDVVEYINSQKLLSFVEGVKKTDDDYMLYAEQMDEAIEEAKKQARKEVLEELEKEVDKLHRSFRDMDSTINNNTIDKVKELISHLK